MSELRDSGGRFLPGSILRREVPIAPLREAFLRSDTSVQELARRLGWMRPDGYRVQRQLGIRPGSNGHGYPARERETMSYERALEICEALGIDPVDVDL